jgi:hypothetical protein
MTSLNEIRKQFGHLATPPGPRGWQNRAARELKYSKGYLSKVVRGLVRSAVAEAAIKEWRKQNQL